MSLQADPFEDRLEAMFADTVPASDAEAFAVAVERRIAASARARRLVYAASLAAAALVAVAILALAGGWGAAFRLGDINLDWLAYAGPAVAVGLLTWLLAELSPNAYRP